MEDSSHKKTKFASHWFASWLLYVYCLLFVLNNFFKNTIVDSTWRVLQVPAKFE